MSRDCPRCHVPFEPLRKAFATVDACPRCGGLFLDPGEGMALHGADSDPTFLVKDGKARLLGDGEIACPSRAHPRRVMQAYAIGEGEDAIEIDHCAACGGVFLDRGESESIEQRVSQAPATPAPGTPQSSPFAAPPRSNQEIAIAELQATADQRPRWSSPSRSGGGLVGDVLGFLGAFGGSTRYGRRHHKHR